MVSDRYILAASEIGICPSVEAGATKTAQLEPGQTIRYRIKNDELLDENQVITRLSEKNPYEDWVKSKPLNLDKKFNPKQDSIDLEQLSSLYSYTPEEDRLILTPMLKGDIPTGSMGNDTSIAVLSKSLKDFPDIFINFLLKSLILQLIQFVKDLLCQQKPI